uniref:Lysine ketoglutarate reductase trans-splicing related 1 n=1 Tax=Davidia involucrata TaxID=16924 RepID=A0A5B7B5U6_DAVIN
MKPYNFVSAVADSKCRRSCLCSLFPAASMLCLFFFIWTAFIAQDHKQNLLRWGSEESMQGSKFNKCKNQCRPLGSETLPEGIFSKTSNLEMRPLWGSPKKNVYSSTNLFSVAVGIRQKKMVDKMVRKFLSSDFVVMLFHYDGIVDEWKDLEWSDLVIHVSAVNQTKWWFAKRFLHPDIVAEYSYIFLWDEDLGVENFNPERYISIVKDEGLEISQPALDVAKSEVHHQITARGRRSNVHRRTYKSGDHGIECDGNSTTPPCTGWIEVMAPVFSRAAWRCVWYMIQNDLIHAWGLDMQLGYCAQGDRTKNIGVVDSEYIVHHGLPTLGEPKNKTNLGAHGNISENKNITSLTQASSKAHEIDYRIEVRRQSYNEFKVFKRRWRKAAEEDKCWIDPYPEPLK